MALIKVVRDTPEVPGGNTSAYVSEDSLREVLSNGWKLADEKAVKETKKEEVKEEKVEEVKPEEPKEEVKEEPKKVEKKHKTL